MDKWHTGGYLPPPSPRLEPEVITMRNTRIIDEWAKQPGVVTIMVDVSKRPPDTAAVMKVREMLRPMVLRHMRNSK